MKKKDIVVGGLYKAKISNKIVTVRVTDIREGSTGTRSQTYYSVVNLTTTRTVTFRSAAKFREPAYAEPRFMVGDRVKIGPKCLPGRGYKSGDECIITKVFREKGGGGHAPGWVCETDMLIEANHPNLGYRTFWEELLEPVLEGENRSDPLVQNAPSAETGPKTDGAIPATNLFPKPPKIRTLAEDLPGSY